MAGSRSFEVPDDTSGVLASLHAEQVAAILFVQALQGALVAVGTGEQRGVVVKTVRGVRHQQSGKKVGRGPGGDLLSVGRL